MEKGRKRYEQGLGRGGEGLTRTLFVCLPIYRIYYIEYRMFARMLSPKMQRMQRSIRINDGQLVGLAEKARCVLCIP